MIVLVIQIPTFESSSDLCEALAQLVGRKNLRRLNNEHGKQTRLAAAACFELSNQYGEWCN